MTGWFFANLAWASLAMLLVLAVRRPLTALFGAGPAYALWLLPALRLVMPPVPSLAPDIPPLLPQETLILWAGDAAAPLPAGGGPGQWMPVLLALWALGAVAFLAWQFVSYRRFLAELGLGARDGGPVEVAAALLLMGEDILGEEPGEHGLDGADAPAALGGHALGDLGGGERRLLPEHLHHRIFAFPDPLHPGPFPLRTT